MELSLQEKQIECLEQEIFELENSLQTLPFYPSYAGILVIKKVKCGKKGCRCQNGELHGPYVYYQYRDNKGVLHQKYLNRKIVEEYADKIKANKEYKATKRKIKLLKNQIAELKKEMEEC